MYEKYEKIEALNWSTVKLMQESPALLKHFADHPYERKDTDDFRLGRATHCAILEPDLFDEEFIVSPDFGNLNSKSGLINKIVFLEDLVPVDETDMKILVDSDKMIDLRAHVNWLESVTSHIEIISEKQREAALRASEAVRAHGEARALLRGTRREHIVQWVDESTGIKCKGRIDAVGDSIIDLKKTRHSTVRQILKSAADYDYHGQVAWYHDGATAAGIIHGHTLPHVIFVHISNTSTFVDVAVISMGQCPETFEDGRKLYKRLISEYSGCQAANLWPGMAPRTIPWELPAYKVEE